VVRRHCNQNKLSGTIGGWIGSMAKLTDLYAPLSAHRAWVLAVMALRVLWYHTIRCGRKIEPSPLPRRPHLPALPDSLVLPPLPGVLRVTAVLVEQLGYPEGRVLT
jgi:hypothetical protein